MTVQWLWAASIVCFEARPKRGSIKGFRIIERDQRMWLKVKGWQLCNGHHSKSLKGWGLTRRDCKKDQRITSISQESKTCGSNWRVEKYLALDLTRLQWGSKDWNPSRSNWLRALPKLFHLLPIWTVDKCNNFHYFIQNLHKVREAIQTSGLRVIRCRGFDRCIW